TETISSSSSSSSVSLLAGLNVTWESSPTTTVSSSATGAVLSGSATVTVTVATLLSTVPSLTRYVNVSVPKKPASAVYVIVPSSSTTAVPFVGCVTIRVSSSSSSA